MRRYNKIDGYEQPYNIHIIFNILTTKLCYLFNCEPLLVVLNRTLLTKKQVLTVKAFPMTNPDRKRIENTQNNKEQDAC